ncbi:Aldo/keto reductase [Jaminaea rosea]|uniref:Aldo/keto reductase n=1 Tax=Jaminaea rosea TaxID=1569628 RepID=A0A316UQC7_9BASI|nr:Aldo/keto reductase [Jaminaea rosea]PWN26511.1 Aldo/keto reductase [Jaminaea rosea]
MPRHPSRSPSPDHFGPAPVLPTAEQDKDPLYHPKNGVAPWAYGEPSPGHAAAPSITHLPLESACSPLIFGGGVFGAGMYNADSYIRTDVPLRTLLLAFRYGVNAIDTSPYYYPSEYILGRLLAALRPIYPRDSYFLFTKCGRYGPDKGDFDYSPQRVRRSVEASLKRLGSEWLDVVYLHDAEFVAEQVGDPSGMNAARVAKGDNEALRTLGLAEGDEGKVHGSGDEVILKAVEELLRLKSEGKVRRIGISGYPLPVLLRLVRLVAAKYPKSGGLDVVLSYSNHTLHSDILTPYLDLFKGSTPTGGPIVFNASPFSMGLLTDAGPPGWHPAREELKEACREAGRRIRGQEGEATLAKTALLYGIRGAETSAKQPTPDGGADEGLSGVRLRTLLGMSSPEQVQDAIEAYRVLLAGTAASTGSSQDAERHESLLQAYETQLRNERIVMEEMDRAGVRDESWPSGI